MDSKTTRRGFFEGLVTVAILLVLVQTVLEDLAVLLMWEWRWRKALLLAGFGFDVFFTLEFLVRSMAAASEGRFARYLSKERGWIDFLASVPLLVFNSGPEVLSLLYGGAAFVGMAGKLKLLKVVKIIRMARILRLLRGLKLVKQIAYIDSPMIQHHISRIAALVVTAELMVLFVYSLLPVFFPLEGVEERYTAGVVRTGRVFTEMGDTLTRDQIITLAAAHEEVLVLRTGGQSVYSRYDTSFYDRMFGPQDYAYYREGALEIFFDMRPVHVESARLSLLALSTVLVCLFLLLFVYAPHFALTVTDPLRVVERGLSEPDYELAARVYPEYGDHEVFRVARLYNEELLPRKLSESGWSSVEGIEDLLGEE